MTDLVTFGETMLRLGVPEGERLERADRLIVHPGGAESNVAVAAAALGVNAVWVSKLPDSPLGRRLTGDLRRHGVEPLVTWSDDGRLGLYFIEPTGAPRGTTVIYDRDQAAVTTATPDELPVDRIVATDCFYVSGITPALSDTLEATTTHLLERAPLAAFDLNYRSKLWATDAAGETYRELLGDVDILFAADRDARSTLDVSGSARAIGAELLSTYDLHLVVVTRGAEGAVAVTDDGTLEQPTFEADTVDPIGTGDAFVGGFLADYLAGEDTASALEYGAATAALKRTIEGDWAVVTREEVERVVEEGVVEIDR